MSAGKLSLIFEEKSVDVRGTAFRFREITGGDYEEIIKLTTGPDGTADLAPVLKLMVLKSLVDPKISADDYSNLPLPVMRQLNDTVNRMHFGEVPAAPVNGETPESPNA